MRRFSLCIGLALISPMAVLAAPFKVSSPSAATEPRLKVEAEFKDGESKETLTLPRIELKTPLAPNLDLAFRATYKAIRQDGRFTQSGVGDIEVKSKWSFFRLGGFAAAVEPLVSFPTGSERRGLGEGDVAFEFPLILGYKSGPWEWGAEAGYTHTLAQADQDTAYLALLAMRRVLPALRLGTEVVIESPDARMSRFDTLLNVGLKWGFAKGFELQALAGTSLHTVDHERVNRFKLAVEVKF